MDPVDAGSFHHALANQGAQVERHDHILQEVMEKYAMMSAQITQIGTQLEAVSTHLAQEVPETPPSPPAPAAPPALPAPLPREPHIPVPEHYAAFEPLQGATIFSKLDLRNAYHLI
ncbi:unnamed protein product [Lota lota]